MRGVSLVGDDQMIITIDGPAGSGKSTVARELAARLDIAYLDTGAMYRAVAHAGLQRGVDFHDNEALRRLAKSIKLELGCGPAHTRVRVDGHDASEAIRTMAVSRMTPYVARHAGIRELMVKRQREIGRALGSFVSEGRDQGSVVFPGADVRIVLEASLNQRAWRRAQEMLADGEDVVIAEVVDNLRARDKVDAKQWEPLLVPGEAVIIDTTDLTIVEVVDRLIEAVQAAAPKKEDSG